VLALDTGDVLKVGYLAGAGNSGAYVTANGVNAAQNNTGTYVTASGAYAANGNTGSSVTATGAYAANGNTGTSVTASGAYAAQNNTGSSVTATGLSAAYANTGASVTASGYAAAYGNTGTNVTATGVNAANGNTGTNVTATGESAALNNTGSSVTASGVNAGRSNTGASVTASGAYAAYSNTGMSVTATGYQSGQSLDIYGRYAPLVGAWAAAKVGAGTLVTARNYKVLYTLDGVDTELSSTVLTVAAGTASTSIDHTGIPVYSGPKICTARKIYKQKAADKLYYLVGAIADNTTTTFSDTQADATYGAVATTPANTMVWGAHATTWGANELAIGSSANPIDTIYLGGQYHLTPATAGRDVAVTVMGGNGTDKAGGKLSLRGGASTGTGAGGAVAIHTSPAAAVTGSTANGYSTRYYVNPSPKTLTLGSATAFARVDFPASSTVTIAIGYNIEITDTAAPPEFKGNGGRYYVTCYRKSTGNAVAGTVVETGDAGVNSVGGAMTDTMTVTGDANGVIISQNAAAGSGMTGTPVGVMTWDIHVHGKGAGIVVTPN